MPMIFCEVCDYFGQGRTPYERLKNVLDHEEREHVKYEDRDWLFEREMERREEEAKLKLKGEGEADDKRRFDT
jgi:hypothetical protein